MKTLALFVFFFCLLSAVVFAEDASSSPNAPVASVDPTLQAAQPATNPTGFAFMSEGTMQLGMLALGLLIVGIALDIFVK